ncbi:MAG: YggT family protein [Chloroflexi bacterium]|nr:YggT family protein [Chloroflexota bacterium]
MIGLLVLVLNILTFAVVARAILSFVMPLVGPTPHPILLNINALINQATEPILGPIRRVLPTMGTMDFSPMVAIIILIAVKGIINSIGR